MLKKLITRQNIFVSYAHEDKDQVIALCGVLEDLGHKVFRDEDIFKVGDTLPDKIGKRIRRSCIFLLCSTENVANSKWVDLEVEVARRRHDRKKLTIIPLLMDDSGYLPELISDILGTDISLAKSNHEQLYEILKDLIVRKAFWWCRFKKWIYLLGILITLYGSFFTYDVMRCELLPEPQNKLCELSVRSKDDWSENSNFKIAILPSPKLDPNIFDGQIEFSLISRIASHLEQEELEGGITVRYCPIEELSDMQKVQMTETALKVEADLALRLVYNEGGESQLEYYLKDARGEGLTTMMTGVLSLPNISAGELANGNSEALKAIDGNLRYCMGLYFHHGKNFQKAIQHFKYCEKVNYLFDGFVYSNLGHGYMFLGQNGNSNKYFRKLVEFDQAGNTHLYHLYKAFEYVANFERDELDSLNKAHCLGQDVLSARAAVRQVISSSEQSEVVASWDSTFFKKSAEIIEDRMHQPRSAITLANAAFVANKVFLKYMELGLQEKADPVLKHSIDYMRKSLEHAPVINVKKQNQSKVASAYNLWETLFQEYNDLDSSYKYYRMAFEYNLRNDRSNTYLLQEGGAVYLRKALDTSLIIDLEKRQSLIDSAERLLTTVLKFDTSDFYSYHNLGLLYLHLRPNAEKAVYNLGQAAKFYPDDLEIQLDYGKVLWQSQDWDQAVKTFDKVLSLASDHYSACDCLRKIYERTGNDKLTQVFKKKSNQILIDSKGCEQYFDLREVCN